MIWCDLDNTLIWRWDPLISSPLLSLAFGLPMETKPPTGPGWRKLKPVEVPGFGSGFVCRRKSAAKFLHELRQIGEVRMLTSAVRPYAETMNAKFGLGFSPEEIVARDAMAGDQVGAVDPAGVLIDNVAQFDRDEAHDGARHRKLLYLGIRASAVVEVPYFAGTREDSFDREWPTYITQIRQIIRRR